MGINIAGEQRIVELQAGAVDLRILPTAGVREQRVVMGDSFANSRAVSESEVAGSKPVSSAP